MKLNTLGDGDFNNKTVLLRVDFNVPVDPKTGDISDVTRIEQTVPTIQYLLDQDAKIVIITHMGRPKGEVVGELRLSGVAEKLAEILGRGVKKLDEVVSDTVQAEIRKMKPKEIVMLENVRFHQEEEKGDENFSKELAGYGDIYVNDAFAACHRDHASITGIPKFLSAYCGFLVQKEVEVLDKVVNNIEHPLTIIVGGAKVDTKIGILQHYIDKADNILVGGALANTFLVARGFDVGESKYEEDKVEIAREIMLEAEKYKCFFGVPRDCIVTTALSEKAEKASLPVEDIIGDMKCVDIGKVTVKRYEEVIGKSRMVIWNGPVGVYEYNRFSHGSKRLVEAIIDSGATSIIGGGDTIDFLDRYEYDKSKFTHVSTAGGAMIEFLEGKELPGIAALKKT